MDRQRTIYTIGHSNRSLEGLVGLLKKNDIFAVADVRSRPFSRFKHFHKPVLDTALPECLIGYFWFGRELGGLRDPFEKKRDKIPGAESLQAMKTPTYEEHMTTALFARGLRTLEELGTRLTTAIMCAEMRPNDCHRRHITRALEERGWRVLHIIGQGEVWTSPMGPGLHLDL